MGEQLLSSDPSAGLLSTDPKAGGVSAPAVDPGGQWVDTPAGRVWKSSQMGSGRQDSNIVGINHEAMRQWLTNWASTLPEPLRKPAAMLATFPAEVLASLTEAASAPESVAAMPGAQKATEAVVQGASNLAKSVPAAAARGAVNATAAVGDVVHPDIIGAVSPRAGKVVELARRLRDKLKASTTTPEAPVAPVETPAAVAAPAPSAPSASAPVPSLKVRDLTPDEFQALQGLKKEGYAEADVLAELAKARPPVQPSAPAGPATPKPKLNASDLVEYRRLRAAGKTDAEAAQLVMQMKRLQQNYSLKTPEQVRGTVADRNASGRWRSDEP